MFNALLEFAGFALLIAAAATVSVGLALLVGGLGLVLAANAGSAGRATRSKEPTE